MFERKITDRITVRLTVPQFAQGLFDVLDKNRANLAKWLIQTPQIKTVNEMGETIIGELRKFAVGQGLHQTIFYEGRVAGAAGFNMIDTKNNVAYIFIWLDEAYRGKGIAKACWQDLIALGFQYFPINKIQGECIPSNESSAALLTKFGFKKEGVLRDILKRNNEHLDHAVYGLLRSEYVAQQNTQAR